METYLMYKTLSFQALVHAVVPDSQPHLWEVTPPGAVSTAVDILIEQLAGMMDPSIDMEEVSFWPTGVLQPIRCLRMSRNQSEAKYLSVA